ncbi:hypothetical protein EUBDOL_00297 [Amedibacillus dolichus DSM 3991]|uniref:Uncharacterized protein n=1 Tax=Amedibacillus dolichus DSM 3991 TaxID=428127 RepID=A8R8G7_9FIRM|nr:hypothetical protein EUBDOL_01344 [Amedibacillus dolichus DSM 3991]EDP12112.1 hypothetical protein EUBDOL_00297 [Amedibacillus dolichus DSM 3991]
MSEIPLEYIEKPHIGHTCGTKGFSITTVFVREFWLVMISTRRIVSSSKFKAFMISFIYPPFLFELSNLITMEKKEEDNYIV